MPKADKSIQVGDTLININIIRIDGLQVRLIVTVKMPFIQIKQAYSQKTGIPMGRLCFTHDSRYIFDQDTVETMGILFGGNVYVTDNTKI